MKKIEIEGTAIPCEGGVNGRYNTSLPEPI